MQSVDWSYSGNVIAVRPLRDGVIAILISLKKCLSILYDKP